MAWIGRYLDNPYENVTPYEVSVLLEDETTCVVMVGEDTSRFLGIEDEAGKVFRVPAYYLVKERAENQFWPPPKPPHTSDHHIRDTFYRSYALIKTRHWDRVLSVPLEEIEGPLTWSSLRTLLARFWELNNHHPHSIVLGPREFADVNSDLADFDNATVEASSWMGLRRDPSHNRMEKAAYGYMGQFDSCNLITDWYSGGVYISSAIPGAETEKDTLLARVMR